MSRYKSCLAAVLVAVVVTLRCSAQIEYPAPTSIAPSLIQYWNSPGLLNLTWRLFLYNADHTYVEINSYYMSGTYAPHAGTYTYSVDPQNPSHATIVYDGGAGALANDDLYFYSANFGGLSPPGVLFAGSETPGFWWSPMQLNNGGINVSNRCQLNSGGVAITGFVVESTGPGLAGSGSVSLYLPSSGSILLQTAGPRWVLLRAVGATLTNFGVSGVVSNPSFTLYDSNQFVLRTSSVWSSDPNLISGYSMIFSLAGAFPLNIGSDEGVLLVQLSPGAYTAVFKAGSAGSILCEVYILPF